MDVFDLAQIVDGHSKNGELYHEFFKAKRLSAGLYVLKAGETDPQLPHTEDEIYYIVSGAGTVEIDGEHREVSAGAVIYVEEHVDHRFHTITEDLSIVVIFAPPRHSMRT
jgi:mannose-6-phosphate isomerase-like protein (cupin superfamily)|tara:strand:- start:290 stop:619 length:330 start_codon:yes stop_codon:yes gene_type:complete